MYWYRTTWVILWLCTFGFIASALEFKEGEWITPGAKAVKRFDTALGAVYELPLHDPFPILSHVDDDNKGDAIDSLQVDLLERNGKRLWKKMERYLVFEFDIRLYPALSKVRNPIPYFIFTRSRHPARNVVNTRDLNGFGAFQNSPPRSGIQNSSPASAPGIRKYSQPEFLLTLIPDGTFYAPYYRLMRIRIILDTNEKGLNSINVNGFKEIGSHSEKFSIQNPTRSFGIFI